MPRGQAHWEDLPASVRHRIQEHRAEERRRAQPAMPGQSRWQCCSCGLISTSYKGAERHADETGHTRIDLLLERKDESDERE